MGHQMLMHRNYVRSYIEEGADQHRSRHATPSKIEQGCPICKNCGLKNLDRYQMFYHCEECKYDLCQVCALMESDPPILKRKMKGFPLHPNCDLHLILKDQTSENLKKYHREGWSCNIADHEEHKPCKSGISAFGQTKYMQGYFCRECNFDICVHCLLYLMEKMKK